MPSMTGGAYPDSWVKLLFDGFGFLFAFAVVGLLFLLLFC